MGLGVEYDQQFQDMVAAVTVLDAEAVAQEFFHTPYISLLGPEEFIVPVAAAQA